MVNQKALTKVKNDITSLLALQKEYEIEPYSSGMHFDRETKYVTWKFNAKQFKTLELLHLTDVQLGHIGCQVDRVKEYISWVLAAKNRYVLFGGDIVDAITKLSVGSPWENISDPQGQVYKACELFAPMRHRILGYVGGNHERRSIPTFGDLGRLISYILRIPYSGGQQLIDIHFGQHKPFKIHLWHGIGNASTKGSKAMMIDRFMSKHPGSQLYLVGHLHDCLILPCVRSERVPGHNRVHMAKYIGGMSSSFLETWGSYAETMGMSPTDVLMLRTVLDANGKFEVTIR
jgi:hypothetical protein